jgi:hypothetical protein
VRRDAALKTLCILAFWKPILSISEILLGYLKHTLPARFAFIDGVADDLGREAMAAVAERSHADTLSDTALAPDPVSVTIPAGPELSTATLLMQPASMTPDPGSA